jgi:hypothetical protein
MKKAALMAVIIVLLAAAWPRPASAAGGFNFYVRGGLVTDESFSFSPFLWTVGANLDLNLSSLLMVSPECDLIVYKLKFDPIWLTPSVCLNFRASAFFVGPGIGEFIVLGSGYTLTSDLLLKLNAGFKTDSFKLQAYAYTPFNDAFNEMIYGATVGFGF